MKILILNYEYPPLGGGAGICTKYEAGGLATLGHQVTVVTTWFKGEKEIEKKKNLTIVRLKSIRKFTFKSNPMEMISYSNHAKKFLSKYLSQNKFDVCLANFTIPGGNVALFLKEKFNLPYILISHGHDIPWFLPKQMFKFHLVTYFYVKKICKNASSLVLLTKEMKTNADKFLGKNKKTVVIENGADLNYFYPNYKIKSKIFKIIFVGRQRAQKDPITFLKAIKIFKEKNPSLHFIVHILGDGPLRKKMESYVKKNNLKEIKFLGWLSKEKMLKEYQSANIQIMPSIAEAMSIATLESLSSGLYIISTKVSGNTDVIVEGVNGNYVPFKDPSAIANALKDFYENKFKKNYTVPKKIMQKLKNKYSWKMITQKYNKLIIKNENL
ncbi:glycosyltransferase family 4 protein [Candidatus Pacearchaeota archaeon]|nr:glycosyltransferase family 4 protein [Candidatus Pacearchaeota archaeon]